MNELIAKVPYDNEFRQSNLICFTESWLKEEMSNPNLPGYTIIRADRDINSSWKAVACVFIWIHAGLPSTPYGNVCAHMTMKSWWSHFVPSTSQESLARLQSHWPMYLGRTSWELWPG